MTEQEKQYWEANHNEAAALDYAVENGQMDASDLEAPKSGKAKEVAAVEPTK